MANNTVPRDLVLHICLAGQTVSNDWPLIQQLKQRHQVTVVDRLRLLSRHAILARADVLVLDSRESSRFSLKVLAFLQKRFPALHVVLVNGGLTQQQIADAYLAGVKDYFSDPYDRRLLADRLQVLGRQNRRARRSASDQKFNSRR